MNFKAWTLWKLSVISLTLHILVHRQPDLVWWISTGRGGGKHELGHCPLASCHLPIDNLLLGALKITKLWLFRAIALCFTRTSSRKAASSEKSFDRKNDLFPGLDDLSLFKENGLYFLACNDAATSFRLFLLHRDEVNFGKQFQRKVDVKNSEIQFSRKIDIAEQVFCGKFTFWLGIKMLVSEEAIRSTGKAGKVPQLTC